VILSRSNGDSFDRALDELRSGGVVAVPTETVYGLAADVRSPGGIAKIFSTKERPSFDPLIVHVSSTSQVYLVAQDFPPLAERLASEFWPGPMTMVLPKRPDLNEAITAGLETVAVRVPDHELTRALIQQLGSPIAAPSANRFGRTSPTTAEHVESEFMGRVKVLDGGPCAVGVESTVISFDEAGKTIRILRPGAVTKELLARFAKVEMAIDDPHAPGHTKHHYMPDIPLVIFSRPRSLDKDSYLRIKSDLKKEVLHPSWISMPSNPVLAARLLYANMRLAARRPGANCLFLEYPLEDRRAGIWAAISDRLMKAATLVIGRAVALN
jgi:L-threonylcarbamoyladenylate synthase